mmetsp:Transcript_47294/g.120683  ORF Transcript_47294/g.120683 Transcript_47294/m.120683 type:complete len:384 (-) Transcript_47294:2804-3955(-)
MSPVPGASCPARPRSSIAGGRTVRLGAWRTLRMPPSTSAASARRADIGDSTSSCSSSCSSGMPGQRATTAHTRSWMASARLCVTAPQWSAQGLSPPALPRMRSGAPHSAARWRMPERAATMHASPKRCAARSSASVPPPPTAASRSARLRPSAPALRSASSSAPGASEPGGTRRSARQCSSNADCAAARAAGSPVTSATDQPWSGSGGGTAPSETSRTARPSSSFSPAAAASSWVVSGAGGFTATLMLASMGRPAAPAAPVSASALGIRRGSRSSWPAARRCSAWATLPQLSSALGASRGRRAPASGCSSAASSASSACAASSNRSSGKRRSSRCKREVKADVRRKGCGLLALCTRPWRRRYMKAVVSSSGEKRWERSCSTSL